jgi:hypothetical protein
MPRASDGTVTLPVGNPIVAGTTSNSDQMNATITDLASMIEDSLSRSGKGGMTAPLRFGNGTVSAPGISFDSESGSGLYREVAGQISGQIGMAVLGVLRSLWTATGEAITGILSATGNVLTGGYFGPTTTTAATVKGLSADGGAAVGVVVDNGTALAAAGSKIPSAMNAGVEKLAVAYDGTLVPASGTLNVTGAAAVTGTVSCADPTTSGHAVTLGYLGAVTWHTITLAGTWGNSGTEQILQYTKDATGTVRLRGVAACTGGGGGDLIVATAALGAGYLPIKAKYFYGPSFGQIKITTGGNITFTANPPGGASTVYFDGVSFISEA